MQFIFRNDKVHEPYDKLNNIIKLYVSIDLIKLNCDIKNLNYELSLQSSQLYQIDVSYQSSLRHSQ